MYYTVIKHSGHLRALEKCRKHEPQASVFCISLMFSNARRVLSQCNTRLRLLYLLNIYIYNSRYTCAHFLADMFELLSGKSLCKQRLSTEYASYPYCVSLFITVTLTRRSFRFTRKCLAKEICKRKNERNIEAKTSLFRFIGIVLSTSNLIDVIIGDART